MMGRKMKMMLLGILMILIVGVMIGCQASQPAKETTTKETVVETKFPEKDISFVVPYTPGGGFDTLTRMLAPYMEKYLPNKVNVVVKNVPGAEGTIGITQTYRAKPDGYTIAIFGLPGDAVNQILGTAEYDLNKVTWLGRVATTTYVMALSPHSKFKTLEDLQKADRVNVSVVGLGTTGGLTTVIGADALGIKNAVYIPHDGSTEALLSAVRGDVDLTQFPLGSLRNYIVDSKDLTPLLVYSDKRLAAIPDVPTVVELGYPDLANTVALHRFFGAAPDVPAEVAQILRDAFSKAVNDPDFLKEASKLEINFGTADESAELVRTMLVDFAEYKEMILEARK